MKEQYKRYCDSRGIHEKYQELAKGRLLKSLDFQLFVLWEASQEFKKVLITEIKKVINDFL